MRQVEYLCADLGELLHHFRKRVDDLEIQGADADGTHHILVRFAEGCRHAEAGVEKPGIVLLGQDAARPVFQKRQGRRVGSQNHLIGKRQGVVPLRHQGYVIPLGIKNAYIEGILFSKIPQPVSCGLVRQELCLPVFDVQFFHFNKGLVMKRVQSVSLASFPRFRNAEGDHAGVRRPTFAGHELLPSGLQPHLVALKGLLIRESLQTDHDVSLLQISP